MTPNPSPLCLPRTPTTVPDCLTEQAVGEVGWANVWKTQGGVVRSLTNMYTFFELKIRAFDSNIFTKSNPYW